jgi:hypothetical protein
MRPSFKPKPRPAPLVDPTEERESWRALLAELD